MLGVKIKASTKTIINELKTTIDQEQGKNEKYENTIGELQRENNDYELTINDLQSRIKELENMLNGEHRLIEIGSKVKWTDPHNDDNKLIGELIDAVNYGKLIIYTVQVGRSQYQGNSRNVKRIDDERSR